MAAPPKFFTRILGVITSVSSTNIGGAAAQANMIVATNDQGMIDSSLYNSGGGGTGSGTNPNSSGVIRNDGSAPGNYVIS